MIGFEPKSDHVTLLAYTRGVSTCGMRIVSIGDAISVQHIDEQFYEMDEDEE